MPITESRRLIDWFRGVLRANILILALNLATGILTARVLGPAGKGLVNASTVWIGVLSSVFLVGLPQALILQYGRAREPAVQDRVFGTALMLAATWGILGAIVSLALLPAVLTHLGLAELRWARLFAVSLPLVSLTQIGLAYLQVERAFSNFNALRVVQVTFVAVSLTVAAFVHLLTPYAQLGIVLASTILIFSVTALMVLRHTAQHMRRPTFSIGPLTWDLSRAGFGFLSTTLAAMFNAQLDQMIAAAWLSAEQVGLYSVAISSLSLVMTLPSAFSAVFFPAVVADDRASIVRRTGTALRRGAVVLVLGAIGLAVFSRPALSLLYGPRFNEAWPAILALSPIAIFGSALTIIYQGCFALALIDIPIIGEVVGAGLSFLLVMVLVPRLGIVGAGISSTVAYAVDLVVVCHLWRVRTKSRLDIWPRAKDLRDIRDAILGEIHVKRPDRSITVRTL